MEFNARIFHAWKVMELDPGPGKSWKMVATFLTHVQLYMFSAFTYIIIVHCWTRFDLLFSTIMNCVTYSVLCEKLLFDIHLIKQSWIDAENGHKLSWKVMENHFQCSVCSL